MDAPEQIGNYHFKAERKVKTMRRGTATQRKKIEKDLINQLEAMGASTEFYGDLVNDYMELWDIKNALIEDIKARGVTTTYNHGGGQSGTKQNESIQNLVKISDRMSKTLATLGIKPDNVATDDDDEITL